MAILSDPRELASLQGQEKFRGRGSRAKNVDLEQSQKDVVSFIAKIRGNVDSSWKATETWRKEAEESYSFVENDQWEEKDKKILVGEGRPALTFNKVLPIIRILGGIERQNREHMKVFPREGGDVDSSDMMTQLIRYVDDENLGSFQKKRKSNDVYITGRGFIKTDVSFDENINGDIIYKRKNPLTIFVDALSEEWDASDWRWVADSQWLTEDEAKELWPDFEDRIKVGDWLSGKIEVMRGSLTGDRLENEKLFLDRETRRVRVFDYWYRRREEVDIAVNLETGDVRHATEKFLEMLLGLEGAERNKIKIIKRKMTVIRVASLMNWLLLQDKPSPYPHRMFPIVPYIGLQYYREPFGAVQPLKDPQRVRNKAYSQAMNHLNRSAHSGWTNKRTGGADPKLLEKFGSVPGVVIEYDEVKPEKIDPTPISSGHFALTRDSDQEIKEISLINTDLQGIGAPRVQSGRAIEERKESGLTGNEDFFDNHLLGDKILGLQLISLIQDTFTPSRVNRIIENRSSRDPESRAAILFRDKKDKLPQLIDMALKGEYDYIIDRAPSSITVRREQFKELIEVAKQFPNSIPPTVLVEASDFPENIKQKIKEHLEQQAELAKLKED